MSEQGRCSAPDLSDTVAVITGGGRGLGATLSRRYAAAGAAVFITGRTEESSSRHRSRSAPAAAEPGGQ